MDLKSDRKQARSFLSNPVINYVTNTDSFTFDKLIEMVNFKLGNEM